MSTASEATDIAPPSNGTPSRRRRLTMQERKAIVASVAQGEPKAFVAKRLGLHRNTVSQVCRDVLDVLPGSKRGLSAWRETLDQNSYLAIESSLEDREDVHRAADSGFKWLKGVGVLQGDQQVNITVAQMIQAIPEDWRSEIVLQDDSTPTSSDSLTHNGAVVE